MKNILITGINGFVGTAAAKTFHEQGFHVVGLVRDINFKSNLDIHKFCSIVRGDILDKDLLSSILSKYEISHILHLAAQPIVRICNSDPYSAYMTNMVGTLNLLESIRTINRKLEKVIIMTSDKAYGPHTVLPYREDFELKVADSYCTSKACQDMVSRSYAQTYDLPVTVVRAGNIYGAGDLNLSRLIPNTILRLLRNENATLYSGVAEYKREFIYVDDIVNAYQTLFKASTNPGEVFNIGGTSPLKTLDVITQIKDKINPSLKVDLIEKQFYEIPEQYLDGTKLQNLGWQAQVDISTGLDRTIKWIKTLNSPFLNFR
jgi:CDP-glucose 4,6-dehydratase